jgi:hypothetical protein
MDNMQCKCCGCGNGEPAGFVDPDGVYYAVLCAGCREGVDAANEAGVAPGESESGPWQSRTGSNVRDRRRAPACLPSPEAVGEPFRVSGVVR